MKICVSTGATITESIVNLFSTIDPESASFVVVPDRATLQIEELLFDTLKLESTFNIDVVSLSGLASRYVGVNMAGMSAIESVLLVKKAIENKKQDLTYFKSSNINFCKEIAKIISQFKSSSLSSSQIILPSSARSSLKRKFKDIALIYAEYERLSEGKEDSSDLIDRFSAAITENNLFSGASFYFAGFDSFTSKHYSLMSALAKVCDKIAVSLPQPISPQNAYIYDDDIFKKLINLSKQMGTEIEVLSSQTTLEGAPLEICRNLFASNLANCQSDNVLILENRSKRQEAERVAKMITFEVYHGARYKDFVVAASDLAAYEPFLSLEFEKHGIPYYLDTSATASKTYMALLFKRMLQLAFHGFARNDVEFLASSPFFDVTSEQKKFISECYRGSAKQFFASDIFLDLRPMLTKMSVDPRSAAVEICGFLKERLPRLDDLGLDEKTLDTERQVLGLIEETLSFCDKNASLKDIISAIDIGLESSQISAIPSYIDQVYVGDVDSSFFAMPKRLFVLGASAGMLPRTHADDGIFADNDFEEARLPKKVEPSIRMLNRRSRFKAFSLLCDFKEQLYLSYCIATDDDKPQVPSTMTQQIIELFNKEDKIIKDFEIDDLDSLLLSIGKSQDSMQQIVESMEESSLRTSLKSVAGSVKNLDRLHPLACAESLQLGKIIRPTEIEKFYDCPFKVYCENVLHLKEKAQPTLSALEIGNVVHGVLEAYGKEYAFKPLEKLQREKFINQQLEKLLKVKNFADELDFVRLVKDLDHVMQLVASESLSSGFENWMIEKSVSGNICGHEFVGRIDRVDKCDNKFRIIDYKTGRISTSLIKDLERGKKLQLFAYADILQKQSSLKCAGVYYFDAKAAYNANESLIGVSVSEHGDDKNALKEETFNNLLLKAEALIFKAAQYMQQGKLLPYPDSGSCKYCKFKALCLYDSDRGYRRG